MELSFYIIYICIFILSVGLEGIVIFKLILILQNIPFSSDTGMIILLRIIYIGKT